MALDAPRCNHLAPLGFKGLSRDVLDRDGFRFSFRLRLRFNNIFYSQNVARSVRVKQNNTIQHKAVESDVLQYKANSCD